MKLTCASALIIQHSEAQHGWLCLGYAARPGSCVIGASACLGHALHRCLRIWAPSKTRSRVSAPRGSPRSSCQTLSHCYSPPSLDTPSPVVLTARTSPTPPPPGVLCCYAVGALRRRWLAEMSYMLPLCQVLLSDVFG
ncbi:hypothetical protein M440DRAFT_319786 [Trichoderma longibrachiatum ATCC 18648]|uniref:Uncharacterized protein n=1 Tax=Trichoderma longibrachiatum ATCC 18648 TaxID=983965 RepID=A0A2T4C4B9_TRILO|nr:hypothetical protein M440DRAFT_319786 [Trichoderma longibrachiatum ATCC 18648]